MTTVGRRILTAADLPASFLSLDAEAVTAFAAHLPGTEHDDGEGTIYVILDKGVLRNASQSALDREWDSSNWASSWRVAVPAHLTEKTLAEHAAAQEKRRLELEAQKDAANQASVMTEAQQYEASVRFTEKKIRIQQEAARRVKRDARPAAPRAVVLRDFLAVSPIVEPYRIEGLWLSGSLALLSAPQKAGKTTLIGNLVRSLADGTPFLNHFDVRRAGRVVLIDTESTEGLLYRWLSDQRIQSVDRVKLIPLRGKEGFLDYSDPDTRAWWLRELEGAETVILDVCGPVVAALGLDEDNNSNVGTFIVGFRALVAEATAGVADALMVHHTGHNEERATGASMWLRTPDHIWQLHRETEDPTSPRYFSVYGRGEDVPRSLLAYEPSTRALTFTGQNMITAKSERGIRELLDWLRTEDVPRNLAACTDYLRKHHRMSRDDARNVAPAGVQKGLLRVRKEGVSDLYSPLDLSFTPD